MRSVIIPVNEGGFLAATIWERSDAKAIVLLHPATAVVQGFYKGFAEYLFNRGFNVLTYDYRGTGLSKSGLVRTYRVSMSDWIDQDVGCITAWAKAHFPGHCSLTCRGDEHHQTHHRKGACLVRITCSGSDSVPYLRLHACQAPGAG